MRVRSIKLLLIVWALLLLPAFAQTSADELPSAPSSTIEKKQPPKQAQPQPRRPSRELDLPPIEAVPPSATEKAPAKPAIAPAQANLLSTEDDEPATTIRTTVN